MTDRIRLWWSSAFAYAAIRLHPRVSRTVMNASMSLLDGLDKEMVKSGRTYGVITVPWATTRQGHIWADHMQKQALQKLAVVRHEIEAYEKQNG